MRSIVDPPPPNAAARFHAGFGRRFVVTLDTEADVDWSKPHPRDRDDVAHVEQIARFQQFCHAEGIVPIYLVDWPIAQSPRAAEILGPAIAAGQAEVGMQLRPWVNPPFEEEGTLANSYPGNLPPALEEAKFAKLRAAIEANFGAAPLIYRAGRHGLGEHSAALLKAQGLAIDSSVRPLFDYSASDGPDYRAFPLAPYWVDEQHELLELPLTSVFWGVLRQLGPSLYPRLWQMPAMRGVLARANLLDRIPLTPEGVSVEEAIRGIDIALDDGLPLLVFAFHSPSLRAGDTPHVRTEEEVEALYDWWRRIFAYCEQRGVRPACVADVLAGVIRQLATGVRAG